MTTFTTIEQVKAAVTDEGMDFRQGGIGRSTWYEARTVQIEELACGIKVNMGKMVCQWHTKAEVLKWANQWLAD